MAEDKCGKKMIAVNREVRHEYFVIEALETGIELVGTEVKSLRAGGVNLKDSWTDIDDGELIAKGIHISPYEQATSSTRTRAVRGVCWHTRRRSAVWGSRSSCRATRWCRSLFTLKRGASSWSWACARAKSCMTSVRLLRRATPSATLTAHSKRSDKLFLLHFPGGLACRIYGAVMVSTGRERREQRAVAVTHDKSANLN